LLSASQGQDVFYKQAAAGTLPQFSFINTPGEACDHPCHDMAKGERLLKDVYVSASFLNRFAFPFFGTSVYYREVPELSCTLWPMHSRLARLHAVNTVAGGCAQRPQVVKNVDACYVR
jgi:hypothetical protein